jgi:hypothetical protein
MFGGITPCTSIELQARAWENLYRDNQALRARAGLLSGSSLSRALLGTAPYDLAHDVYRSTRPLSIREELQAEVNIWLHGVLQ